VHTFCGTTYQRTHITALGISAQTSWHYIPVHTFCGTTYQRTHGTDDVLWNGSEKDGNVRSECADDEGTDCDDGDSDTEWYR